MTSRKFNRLCDLDIQTPNLVPRVSRPTAPNRPHEYEALGSNPHKFYSYSPEPRAESIFLRGILLYRNWPIFTSPHKLLLTSAKLQAGRNECFVRKAESGLDCG